MEVGRHAMAETQMAFLDHTQSSTHWFSYKLGGVEYGEIAQEALYAASYGVPFVFLSGDRAACREAESQFPGVATAEAKWAVKRNAAHCLSGPVARARIAEGARKGMDLARRKAVKPVTLSVPITMELTLQRTDQADDYMGRQGIERVGPRTIRAIMASQRDILRF